MPPALQGVFDAHMSQYLQNERPEASDDRDLDDIMDIDEIEQADDVTPYLFEQGEHDSEPLGISDEEGSGMFIEQTQQISDEVEIIEERGGLVLTWNQSDARAPSPDTHHPSEPTLANFPDTPAHEQPQAEVAEKGDVTPTVTNHRVPLTLLDSILQTDAAVRNLRQDPFPNASVEARSPDLSPPRAVSGINAEASAPTANARASEDYATNWIAPDGGHPKRLQTLLSRRFPQHQRASSFKWEHLKINIRQYLLLSFVWHAYSSQRRDSIH